MAKKTVKQCPFVVGDILRKRASTDGLYVVVATLEDSDSAADGPRVIDVVKLSELADPMTAPDNVSCFGDVWTKFIPAKADNNALRQYQVEALSVGLSGRGYEMAMVGLRDSNYKQRFLIKAGCRKAASLHEFRRKLFGDMRRLTDRNDKLNVQLMRMVHKLEIQAFKKWGRIALTERSWS